MIYCQPHTLSNCKQCIIDKQKEEFRRAQFRSGDNLRTKDAQIAKLIEDLKEITQHFMDVMGGPLITGRGIKFDNGIENIPTIKQALETLSLYEELDLDV